MNSLSLAVLGAVVLLGAALLWAALADRRRQGLQQRLKSVVAASRVEDEPLPALTLRRRIQAGPGALSRLPSELWARLEGELAAAGDRIGAAHLFAAGLLGWGAVFIVLTYMRTFNPAVTLLLSGAAAPAAALVLLRLAQTRYRNQFLEAFPDALDLICRAVRAGLPVTEAMAVAAREVADPVGSELRRALGEMQIGVEPQDALQRTADRIRVPDFRFYVVTIALQRRTGGGLAETLTNLSTVIRARKALRLKARALSAESKASAFILALLPFVVGSMLYLINTSLMSILLTDPRGRMMLGIAIGTLVAGIFVMSWMIKWSLR